MRTCVQEHAQALLSERAKHDVLQKQMQEASTAHVAAVKGLEDKLRDANSMVSMYVGRPAVILNISKYDYVSAMTHIQFLLGKIYMQAVPCIA